MRHELEVSAEDLLNLGLIEAGDDVVEVVNE